MSKMHAVNYGVYISANLLAGTVVQRAYAFTSNTANHFGHEKLGRFTGFSLHVCLLGIPSGRRSSTKMGETLNTKTVLFSVTIHNIILNHIVFSRIFAIPVLALGEMPYVKWGLPTKDSNALRSIKGNSVERVF